MLSRGGEFDGGESVCVCGCVCACVVVGEGTIGACVCVVVVVIACSLDVTETQRKLDASRHLAGGMVQNKMLFALMNPGLASNPQLQTDTIHY